MKKILTFLVAVIATVILVWCSTDSALTYNDELVDLSDALNNVYTEYEDSAVETSVEYTDRLEERRKEAVAKVNIYLSEMKGKKPFRNDGLLLNAMIADGESVLSLLENEHKELTSLRTKLQDNENISDVEAAEYKSQQEFIVNRIMETIQQDVKNLQSAQALFAERYWFEIEE